MADVRVEKANGDIETLTHIKSEIMQDLNKQDIATITVPRDDVNSVDPQEGEDEIYIIKNNTDRFGGLVRDVKRGGSIVEIVADSFERYARDAEPTGAAEAFSRADSTIVEDAISRVDQLTVGNIETLQNVNYSFNYSSPANMIRVVRNITGGEVRYNPDKTVDYINEQGSTKTTVLSPANQNLTQVDIERTGGEEKATHLRMLGSGKGPQQTSIDVVSESYEEGDRKIWKTITNKAISSPVTLESQGKTYLREMDEQKITINATVRNVDIAVGDKFHIIYDAENIDINIRCVEVREVTDRKGERYEVKFSNREVTDNSRSQQVNDSIQQISRGEPPQSGTATFDDPNAAPQTIGNVIYINGADSDPKGIYHYDIDENGYIRGTNASLSDLSEKNLDDLDGRTLSALTDAPLSDLTAYDIDNNDLEDGTVVIYDAASEEIPQDVQGGPAGELSSHPLTRGTDFEELEVDIGYVQPNTANSAPYTESITTGFEPQYVEFMANVHQGSFGAAYDSGANTGSGANAMGLGFGMATGSANSEQLVSSLSMNSDDSNAHRSFVYDGYVIYIPYLSFHGENVDGRVSATIQSFDSDGFTLEWENNYDDPPILYRAFR
jgi:hypothetical protein